MATTLLKLRSDRYDDATWPLTRSVSLTGQFKRDVKLAQKRGKDLEKLRNGIALLVAGDALPPELRDHPLKGEWRPSRDIHIEPDWILIYAQRKCGPFRTHRDA